MYNPTITIKKGGIGAVIVGASCVLSAVICKATGIPDDVKPQVDGMIAAILSGGILSLINAIKHRKDK